MSFSVNWSIHLSELIGSLAKQIDWQATKKPSMLMLGRQDASNLGKTPEAYFRELGFGEVDSLDISSSDSPTIIHDLNQPVPDHLRQKYDCVYDGGTMEHVFDVKTCLFNIHDLLRCGGVAIHSSPMNNMVNHGFYQFSPTLFYGFYRENGYRVAKTLLTVDVKGSDIESKKFVDCTGDQIEAMGLGWRVVLPDFFSPKHMVTVTVGAIKPDQHRDPIIPVQPIYSDTYSDKRFDKLKGIVTFGEPA